MPDSKLLEWKGDGVHLYGKAEPRPGRKMGHLAALATTATDAKQQVLAARGALYNR